MVARIPGSGGAAENRTLRSGGYSSRSGWQGLVTAASVAEQPAYTLAEAARYSKLPIATLRSWVVGRSYPTAQGSGRFRPLIHPASPKPPLLSFSNLIEAHVLRALRTDRGVSVRDVRRALGYAEEELGVERLLLRGELCSQGGKLFLDRYGELINLSASGQLAMRKVFDQHLRRVERDTLQMPIRLYPFVSRDEGSLDDLIAVDYDLAPAEVEEAVVYERAA